MPGDSFATCLVLSSFSLSICVCLCLGFLLCGGEILPRMLLAFFFCCAVLLVCCVYIAVQRHG